MATYSSGFSVRVFFLMTLGSSVWAQGLKVTTRSRSAAFEDGVQHGVVLPHRRGRETVPVLCGAGGSHPALDLRGQDLAHGPAAEGGDEVLVEVGPVGGEGGGLDVLGGQPHGFDVLGEGDLPAGVVVPGTVADLGFSRLAARLPGADGISGPSSSGMVPRMVPSVSESIAGAARISLATGSAAISSMPGMTCV